MRSAVRWLGDAVARLTRETLLRRRFARSAGNSDRWNAIRDAWAEQLPIILDGQCVSPYFLDWDMTPIEGLAWNIIRSTGLPLYPQCPVNRVFVDFGDPLKRLGLELDGKFFHHRAKDTKRDEELWCAGWRIFRIRGSEAHRPLAGPYVAGFADDEPRDSQIYNHFLYEWASKTAEGVLWALAVIYYDRNVNQNERAIALCALEEHHLADFPLLDQPNAGTR